MSEFLPKLYVLRLLLAILAWNVSDVFSDDQVVRLGDRFDSESARVSTILIARTAGEDSSTVFASLSRPDRAIFLDVFWESRNPLIHKYYYGLHFGRRRFSVSDSFFERMTVVPELLNVVPRSQLLMRWLRLIHLAVCS